MESIREYGNNGSEKGLISVIVPAYNCSCTIGRCIESVLEQTYANLELVVVFNDHLEDTGDICRQYAAKDERVRPFEASCKGVSGTRNCGLANARGEYIAFLDSDDCIEPEYLQKLLNALCKNKCAVSMCNYDVVEDDSKTICRNLTRYGEVVSYDSMINDSLYCRIGAYCWGKLWRRDALIHGFSSFNYSEDTLLMYSNMAGMDGNVAYVNEVLYHYIRRDDSITTRKNVNDLFDSLRVAKIIVRKSEKTYKQYARASYAFIINYAFFTYLSDKTGEERFAKEIDGYCIKLIKKYRFKAMLDVRSSYKTKCACLLSLFSMRLVESAYSRFN